MIHKIGTVKLLIGNILPRAYSRNFGQRSILTRKGTFYEKRTLFLKKGHQKLHSPPLNPFSKCFASK